jgi:RES domain-containing protein
MSRSLASLEFLVHVPWGLAPADLSLITISVPDDASVRTIESHHLPAGWAQSPPPGQVADVGTDWLTKGESLLLRVPTALVMAEWNVLINPRHREIAQVRILAIEPFEYDPRLLGER